MLFGLVILHRHRKVDQWEWSDAVSSGSLTLACKNASGRQRGPWTLLCDNEFFLEAKTSRAAHARLNVHLWSIPARSPNLPPVGMFWSRVRRWLRAMDLQDLKAGRPPVQKTAMKDRVRRLLRSAKARNAAVNIFATLRKKAAAVKKKKGAAIRG